MAGALTLSTIGRNACLKTTASATIPGGLNWAISQGSTNTYPKVVFYDGVDEVASEDLHATEPLLYVSDGVVSLQRPAAAPWTGGYQPNATGTGTPDNGAVMDRDENVIGTFTVGATGSNSGFEGANLNFVSGSPFQYGAAPTFNKLA